MTNNYLILPFYLISLIRVEQSMLTILFIILILLTCVIFYRLSNQNKLLKNNISNLENENKYLEEKLTKIITAINTENEFQNDAEDEFEEKVINHLKEDWEVYRNVEIEFKPGGSQNSFQQRAEIDFLLFHKDYGFALFEIKGGKGWRYNAKNDQWTVWVDNKEKRHEGPYAQVANAQSVLRARLVDDFKKLDIKIPWLQTVRFVVWNNMQSTSDNAKFGFMDYPGNTIWQEELDEPLLLEEKIIKSFKKSPGKYDNPQELKIFKKALNREGRGFSLVTYNGKVAEEVKKLSNDLVNAFYEITNDEFKKIKIKGIPGSGKTFLAERLAVEESKKTRKVLFLCYNILLGEELKIKFKDTDNVTVLTFEDFINTLGISFEDEITYKEEKRNLKNVPKEVEINYLKQNIEDKVSEAIDLYEFDTLIIDEAQDFSEEYWDFFELLVIENKAKWAIFYDVKQNLTHENWKEPEYLNTAPLILNTVIRCTRQIADKYKKIFGDDTKHFGASGMKPELVPIEDGSWSNVNKEINSILKDIYKEDPKLIKNTTILLPHRQDKEHIKISSVETEIDSVPIYSIGQFKGLESDIIILAVPNKKELISDYVADPKKLLYIGLSRAKTSLYFICNKEVQIESNW